MSSPPLNLTVKTPGGSLKMVGKVSHAITKQNLYQQQKIFANIFELNVIRSDF